MAEQLDMQSSQKQRPDALALLVALLEQVLACAEGAAAGDEAEGLSPKAAARFLGISESQLHYLRDKGLMPQFALMGDGGRCVRISRSELKAWLLAGCPSRVRWESMRDVWLRKVA